MSKPGVTTSNRQELRKYKLVGLNGVTIYGYVPETTSVRNGRTLVDHRINNQAGVTYGDERVTVVPHQDN